ncbi:hypothetical protein WICPIJ_003494 [Wickerhamomyces pijperi]|uniref:Uncharacterized protein n=1 Tax=Wickerhamomyces pijperi TaxID=599730 RepID=A0A9P8Q7Q3_WICPI|nr:hypothetical protein WICPIJ_003494 [Wickerhamomyces pijperi]
MMSKFVELSIESANPGVSIILKLILTPSLSSNSTFSSRNWNSLTSDASVARAMVLEASTTCCPHKELMKVERPDPLWPIIINVNCNPRFKVLRLRNAAEVTETISAVTEVVWWW